MEKSNKKLSLLKQNSFGPGLPAQDEGLPPALGFDASSARGPVDGPGVRVWEQADEVKKRSCRGGGGGGELENKKELEDFCFPLCVSLLFCQFEKNNNMKPFAPKYQSKRE